MRPTPPCTNCQLQSAQALYADFTESKPAGTTSRGSPVSWVSMSSVASLVRPKPEMTLSLYLSMRSLTLETAVGRARVGCDGMRWQGERCGSRCARARLDSSKKASLWLDWGLQGRRRCALRSARRSNAAGVRQRSSIGCGALSPMRCLCWCAQKLEFLRRLQRKKAVNCGFQVNSCQRGNRGIAAGDDAVGLGRHRRAPSPGFAPGQESAALTARTTTDLHAPLPPGNCENASFRVYSVCINRYPDHYPFCDCV